MQLLMNAVVRGGPTPLVEKYGNKYGMMNGNKTGMAVSLNEGQVAGCPTCATCPTCNLPNLQPVQPAP